MNRLLIGALCALALFAVAAPISPAHAGPGFQQCDDSSPPLCAPYKFVNITTATTTVVKSGNGVLHTICINKYVASATIALYDNTAASGTLIGTITAPATLVVEGGDGCNAYDIAFSNGLTIVTVGAQDITATFR